MVLLVSAWLLVEFLTGKGDNRFVAFDLLTYCAVILVNLSRGGARMPTANG
jgi:hypothetical protein